MIAELQLEDLLKPDSMEQENKPKVEGALIKVFAAVFYFQALDAVLRKYLGAPDPLALTMMSALRGGSPGPRVSGEVRVLG